MIEVNIKQTEPMYVAFLSMHASYDQMPQAFGPLYSFAAEKGLIPTGAPRAVYFTPPDQSGTTVPDWELWAPVAQEVPDTAPDERGLGTRQIPGSLVASTMYQGPYDTIGSTYRELGEWVGQNGYTMAGPPAEIYYSDPAEVPPDKYLTEIQFPVARASA